MSMPGARTRRRALRSLSIASAFGNGAGEGSALLGPVDMGHEEALSPVAVLTIAA